MVQQEYFTPFRPLKNPDLQKVAGWRNKRYFTTFRPLINPVLHRLRTGATKDLRELPSSYKPRPKNCCKNTGTALLTDYACILRGIVE